MSQEYELINYSEHGTVVDGVLYSCDFSDKVSSSSTSTSASAALTVDDITALGPGRRAEKARERLRVARKSLEDKLEAKRALEAALKLAIPASVQDESLLAEEMSKAEGLVTRMGLKRVAAETSVVSIPLAKTRKVESMSEQKTTTTKVSTASQDKSKTTLTLTTQTRNGAKKGSGLKETNNQLKNNYHRAPPNEPTQPPQTKKEAKVLLPPQVEVISDSKDTESSMFGERIPSKEPSVPCMCRRSASSIVGANGKGWEGTATLYHGSRLRFGCIQFVLSLAGRPGHAELVEGLGKLSNSTLSILNSDQSNSIS